MSRRFSFENGNRPVMFIGAVAFLVVAAGLSNAFEGPDRSSGSRSGDNNISLNFDDGGDYGTPVARDLADFTTIQIKGGMALRIDRGDFKVEVAVEDDDQDWVETSVDEGVLIIDAREEKWDDRDVMVRITMPAFEGLDVRGAVDARIDDVQSETVTIDLRGAGNIELAGTCDSVTVDIKGAGNVEAEDLECASAVVMVRGAGNAEVYASESVKAELAGIGNIDVYGKPKSIDKSVRGIGEIDIN